MDGNSRLSVLGKLGPAIEDIEWLEELIAGGLRD